jgi:hypothetical protein
MKKNIFLLLLALSTVFLGGCIVIINNDFDITIAYFKNDSSRNIYIQSYTELIDYFDPEEPGIFFANGISLKPNTVSETAAPSDYERPYLKKILFVDTDTKTLLKKITGDAYYKTLSDPEIKVVKKSDGGKDTFYTYYFVITDEFLESNP